MSLNVKCPKCGSDEVQITSVGHSRGLLWFIIFGWFYLVLLPLKWMIGLAVLVCIDSWMYFLKKAQGVGYIWKCKRWFFKLKTYYCHSCHNNFKG